MKSWKCAAMCAALVFVASQAFGQMLELHNTVRARTGRGPLVVNSQLQSAAQGYANILHRTRGFGHYAGGTTPTGRIYRSGYAPVAWGENMAVTPGGEAAAFSLWRSSSGHNANILGNFKEVGFGSTGNYYVAVYGSEAVASRSADPPVCVNGNCGPAVGACNCPNGGTCACANCDCPSVSGGGGCSSGAECSGARFPMAAATARATRNTVRLMLRPFGCRRCR